MSLSIDARGDLSGDIKSGLAGPRLAAKLPGIGIKPYGEILFGVATFTTTAAGLKTSNKFACRYVLGVDATILPHIDWRVADFSYGINESGSGLSGGQRQRVLLAQAIVHRPRVLLLDEATSALDNQTQAVVSRSLDAMQSTRVVIAHRLSTILHADIIMVFKAGRLHESGNYAELVARNGYFAELAKRQLLE